LYLLGPLVVVRAGYPGVLAGIIAAGVVLISGRTRLAPKESTCNTSSCSIANVLPFRPGPLTWWMAVIILALVGWRLLISAFGIGGSIKDEFFAWLPGWALDPLPASFANTGSSTAQAMIGIGYLVFLVLLAALVEELYFRATCYNASPGSTTRAPLINAALFATYHL
jgi:membrane protease YdiL (CAAX protease family)